MNPASTPHEHFARNAVTILEKDPSVIGLAVAGSWLSNEIDEYSDLDLVLVTKERSSGDKNRMLSYAGRLGDLVSAFTGEHVGEPRLLVCLFENPLLHVDIKFLLASEFGERIADPFILFERESQLSEQLKKTSARWPETSLQWIEDRFWTWVHYIATRIGRGELFEALDGLGFIRGRVLAPLFHLKYNSSLLGLRRIESRLSKDDLEKLKNTVAVHDKDQIMDALQKTIELYRELRSLVFQAGIVQNPLAEKLSVEYFEKLPR